MKKEDLKKFTDDIAEIYEAGKIKAPVHLCGSEDFSNEKNMIRILEDHKERDWVFSTWRSSYAWLCSGRDPEELKKQICEGHSMHVYGKNFFTSAIVGGIPPIALGVAWAMKLKGNINDNMVYCFVGDGGYHCGLTQECIRYASGHDLPICFILEDNDLTVRADTKEIWGRGRGKKVLAYKYKRKYTHAGHGLEGGPKAYVMF